METYDRLSYDLSRQLTLGYSTSFGISSRLLGSAMRRHVYAIYALVRVADEIVDTYKGADAAKMLDDLEREAYETIARQFSSSPVVHAFAKTAKQFGIGRELIHPFFESMRMDLTPVRYDERLYKKYIHGSAEVVGLMCLRVFCQGDEKKYYQLEKGASALGSAYQKVNFLRDMAADYAELGRIYFPGVGYDNFDEAQKDRLIKDIQHDFALALPSLRRLPAGARTATMTSYVYYNELLKMLASTPVEKIKTTRLSVPSSKKLRLLIFTVLREGLKK